MKLLQNSWFNLICRIVAGSIFVYAGLPKILDPCDFARSIHGYGIFPHIFINLSAIVVPWFELTIGICLILGIWTRTASFMMSGMLCFFVVILSVIFVQGADIDCGCFSSANDWCKLLSRAVTAHIAPGSTIVAARLRSSCELIRDFLFFIPALLVFTFRGKQYALENLFRTKRTKPVTSAE